jgi:universal stress protein E
MKIIQTLLVVLDNCVAAKDDEYSIELEKALRLATDKSSTHLVLFSVAYQKHLDHDFLSLDFNQAEKRQEYCDELLESVNSIADRLKAKGYQVTAEVKWGYPSYEQVIAKASAIAADLIVKHCRAYGKLDINHLSNDSWQLVRHCSVPLLLVKNKPWSAKVKLLAAIDPMHNHDKPQALDHKIMAAAQILSEALAGELHVVHAYAEAARPFAPAGRIKSEHNEALTEFLAGYSIPETLLHFVDATPIMALEKEADEIDPDIIAMGAMSRSRLSEMLIGSTAEQVLDFINTDILILKPTAA